MALVMAIQNLMPQQSSRQSYARAQLLPSSPLRLRGITIRIFIQDRANRHVPRQPCHRPHAYVLKTISTVILLPHAGMKRNIRMVMMLLMMKMIP